MSMPTNEQLSKLHKIIIENGKMIGIKWYSYEVVLDYLKRNKIDLVVTLTQAGASKGVTVASGVATATVGVGTVAVGIAPLGLALAPWFAAAATARVYDYISELYQIIDTKSPYPCCCHKCKDNIQYVINKKERNVAIGAASVFTVGTVYVGKKLHSFFKWADSKINDEIRPKEKVSRDLIISARDNGCTRAMAAIFIIVSNWESMRGGSEGTMRRAVAIIASEDGWEELKKEW